MDTSSTDAAPKYPHRQRDAEWVAQARSGDERAFGQLYDAWFDRVFDLAQRIVRNRDIALEVTQDAFLSAWRSLPNLEEAGSFGGWLLRIARNGALNRQQREQRSVAIDDPDFAVMEAVGGSPSNAPAGFSLEDRLAAETDPQRALEDAETRDLVWQAAAALGERDTEVLNLQLRHGLTPAEIGDVLGLNRNAANQLVHRVRGRFEVALRARLLWRDDQPACRELASLLSSAGVTSFSVEAVKIADKHAPGCSQCSERRKSRLAPAAMFGAIPVLVAPIAFKQQAAYALEEAGTPMGGSAFSSSALAGGTGEGASGGDGTARGSSDEVTSPAPGGSAGPNVGRRVLAMAAVGVVIVVALTMAVTGRVSDNPSNEVEAFAVAGPGERGTSSLTGGASVGTDTTALDSSTTDAPADAPASSEAPDPTATSTTAPTTLVGAPGLNPVPTPTTAAASPSNPLVPIPGPTVDTKPAVTSATISVAPNPAALRYRWNPAGPDTVLVSWSVEGDGITSARVYGKGLDTEGTSGTVKVCPGTTAGVALPLYCSSARGAYVYTLYVELADGSSTQRTATLTIA